MAYIMLPGMGSWGTSKGKTGWGRSVRLSPKTEKKSGGGMLSRLKEMQQGSSRDDGNWRQKSEHIADQKPTFTATQVKQPAPKLPAPQDTSLPTTRATDVAAPQDSAISPGPQEENITPPSQLAPYETTQQTYQDIPPEGKKGIDKKLLIGGGLAAAGLVAAVFLLD